MLEMEEWAQRDEKIDIRLYNGSEKTRTLRGEKWNSTVKTPDFRLAAFKQSCLSLDSFFFFFFFGGLKLEQTYVGRASLSL